MADLDKLVDELSKLTVIEAAELAKKLEETWGVSAAAPVAVAVAAGGEAHRKPSRYSGGPSSLGLDVPIRNEPPPPSYPCLA